MSAFVIALSIPLLPIFGAITIGEAAIKARQKGSTLKEELSNILNENDSHLIEKFHSETTIIFRQEIDDFIEELTKLNVSETQLNSIKENLLDLFDEWDKILEIRLIKKDKILTVYDITLSELQTLSEKKLLELKNKINEIKTSILSENKKTKKYINNSISKDNPIKNFNKIDKNYKIELFHYFNKLAKIDKNSQKKYQSMIINLNNYSSQRAKLLLDEIKLIYAKRKKELIMTEIYKEELNKLYSKTINYKYKKELEKTLQKKIITKKEYEKLFLKLKKSILLQEQIKKDTKLLATDLSKLLNETNYTIIENEQEFIDKFSHHKRIIIPIKNTEYKVIMQLNKNNEILTRFVKVVSENNLSTSEKLRDKSELKKWCNIQKKIYEKIRENFDININIIEDEESDVLYVIDNEKKISKNLSKGNKWKKQF